jgi:DNA-binding PadR family transcriptional regulator
MARLQMSVLSYLRDGIPQFGEDIMEMLEERGASSISARQTIKMLARRGLVVTEKNQNKETSKHYEYQITQYGLFFLKDYENRRRPVNVKTEGFVRPNIACDSAGCKHAEGDVCSCRCGGAHHSIAVTKISLKRKAKSIKQKTTKPSRRLRVA